jgi:predicted Holliday junction resolvase-like endonuclease
MSNNKNNNIFYVLIVIIIILLSIIIIKYTDIFCDLKCNQMKMENISECTQEMYRDNGRGFTDKQKNDYMKACIRSYEQVEMKERLQKRKINN